MHERGGDTIRHVIDRCMGRDRAVINSVVVERSKIGPPVATSRRSHSAADRCRPPGFELQRSEPMHVRSAFKGLLTVIRERSQAHQP